MSKVAEAWGEERKEAGGMKIAVDVESATRRERGELTDEHLASSHGVPVLVIAGRVLGPGPLSLRFGRDVNVRLAGKMLTWTRGAMADFLARARSAGYDVGGPAEAGGGGTGIHTYSLLRRRPRVRRGAKQGEEGKRHGD